MKEVNIEENEEVDVDITKKKDFRKKSQNSYMIKQLKTQKILWILIAGLSLVVSIISVFNPQIYQQVLDPTLLPAIIAQDFINIIQGVILLIFAIRIKSMNIKQYYFILGILAYFFYAYGMYVIEQLYTSIYLIYMVIFSLSLYGIIYGLTKVPYQQLEIKERPKLIRNVILFFLILMPLIFYPLWISHLIPLMREGQKLEFMYSIYIIDLCFIMPAFVITSWKTYKKKITGPLHTISLYVLGYSILLPIPIGEIIKLFYGLSIDIGGFVFFTILSILFMVFLFVHLKYLHFEEKFEKEGES